MPHMIIVLIQGLFLKNCYHSFFWPNLASQSEILQIDCTLAYEYIVICDCGFDVYFSKMFVIYILVSKSCYNCLKRELRLLHAEFFVFRNSFPKTRVLK